MRRHIFAKLGLAFLVFCFAGSHSIAAAEVHTNISYATVGAHSLKLDLYLTATNNVRPLIVWVHGGAWKGGSRSGMPLGKLVELGYPVASIDYRLSTEAPFPAQAHDIKAAIRFLRGHSTQWKLDARRIIIAGDSAGAHLAALVGVSNGETKLEGEVGNDLQQSSAVQGILSFYGASDLTTILDQSTPFGLNVRVPALELLFGGQPKDKAELARLASPVFFVDKNDPPLLLFHGDRDPQMPINQSLELQGAYEKVGAPVEFHAVHGAGHGGSAFYDPVRMAITQKFLEKHFP
jgi:acetyl esterase/lipase